MRSLQIQHAAGEHAWVRVVRQPDGMPARWLSLTSPVGSAVPGAGDADLLVELDWYLERFPEYPSSPRLEWVEQVRQALTDGERGPRRPLWQPRDRASAAQLGSYVAGLTGTQGR